MAYLSVLRGQPLRSGCAFTARDLAIHKPKIEQADMVIASEPGNGLVHEWLPSAEIQQQTLDYVRSMEDMELVGEFPAMSGKRFYLFGKKREQFTGFESVLGLEPLEGPFPQMHLPQGRWASGPATTLRVKCQAAGAYDLSAKMWTNLPGQAITVLVNGVEVAKIEMPLGRMQPLMQEKIPLNLPAGESKVELLYAKQHKDVGRPITVYYCRLALQPRVVPQGK